MALRRGPWRILLSILLVLFTVSPVAAQNFRGETGDPTVIDGPEVREVRLSAGQVLLVLPDEDYPFVAGIAIRVESGASPVGQDYALSVFGSVDPPASPGINNLAGVELASTVLAASGRTTIVVPFQNSSGIASVPGAMVADSADPATGAVAVQLVPIMKGMSSEALGRSVPVQVRPILRPVGALRVRLAGDPGVVERARADLNLVIDGRPVETDVLLELSPGIYRLRATASDLLDYTGNVGIEMGRVEEVVLPVEEPQAQVRFAVPSVAEVFFDGERVRGRSITVPPGTHTVLIRLGDFSVSRQVALDRDGTYRIGLDLDISVNRD